MIIASDPNLSFQESLSEPKASINTLDLSMATNLVSIEEEAFNGAGITSVNFGENSNLEMIGDYAFRNNQISSLTLPSSITEIGGSAFSGNPITSILIKRTKEDFEASVTVGSSWYSGTPTITYEP